MGNGIRKLSLCFAGEISRRRNDIAVCLSDPLDEGLGHSFCRQTAVFRTISGAAISANTSTPYATTLDKASSFESSNFFSSIPLQPIPRNSFHTVRSGPITRSSGQRSNPMERGFMSGPIERSFISGPLDNHFDLLHRYRPSFKKMALVKI